MKESMGKTDRTVRLIVAVIFAVLYFTGVVGGTLGTVLLVLAVVFAVTAFVKFCPLYLPFKISTKGK